MQIKEGKRELLGEGENEREDELVMESEGVEEKDGTGSQKKEEPNRQLGEGVTETAATHL